jgi:hypothetical protein
MLAHATTAAVLALGAPPPVLADAAAAALLAHVALPPVLADAAAAALLALVGPPPVLALDALPLHRCRLCRSCCRLFLRCCLLRRLRRRLCRRALPPSPPPLSPRQRLCLLPVLERLTHLHVEEDLCRHFRCLTGLQGAGDFQPDYYMPLPGMRKSTQNALFWYGLRRSQPALFWSQPSMRFAPFRSHL